MEGTGRSRHFLHLLLLLLSPEVGLTRHHVYFLHHFFYINLFHSRWESAATSQIYLSFKDLWVWLKRCTNFYYTSHRYTIDGHKINEYWVVTFTYLQPCWIQNHFSLLATQMHRGLIEPCPSQGSSYSEPCAIQLWSEATVFEAVLYHEADVAYTVPFNTFMLEKVFIEFYAKQGCSS